MPSLSESYYTRANELLAAALEIQCGRDSGGGAVDRRQHRRGGVVHTFGSAHSEVIARESSAGPAAWSASPGSSTRPALHRESARLRRQIGRTL